MFCNLTQNYHHFFNNKAVLEPRVSPAFASTYFCNHCNSRFENTSKYVDTLILFSKNLNQRSLTPTWPLTPCLLRSHVWLYPRIIVSKSHDNTSMYVDTVINFANYHIHTHTTYIQHTTYYVHTTYRMSDHIVSYWTQFRRDKYDVSILKKILVGHAALELLIKTLFCLGKKKKNGSMNKLLSFLIYECLAKTDHFFTFQEQFHFFLNHF